MLASENFLGPRGEEVADHVLRGGGHSDRSVSPTLTTAGMNMNIKPKIPWADSCLPVVCPDTLMAVAKSPAPKEKDISSSVFASVFIGVLEVGRGVS